MIVSNYMYMCLYVEFVHMSAITLVIRRGCQIPRSWSYRLLRVVILWYGTQTPDLCKHALLIMGSSVHPCNMLFLELHSAHRNVPLTSLYKCIFESWRNEADKHNVVFISNVINSKREPKYQEFRGVLRKRV